MKEIPPTAASFAEIAAASARLLGDIAALSESDVRAPSGLPGWSRAHVLSHLAAQVPALGRLAEWARTGVRQPQYTDRTERDAEIEARSRRPAAELVEAATAGVEQFRRAIEDLPGPAWDADIVPFTGEKCTPKRLLVIRLRELEVHHVDLDLGYGFADIPDGALSIVLDDVTQYLAEHDSGLALTLCDPSGGLIRRYGTGGPLVSGPRAAVLAWLTGRSTGQDLSCAASRPVLPKWI